jgi:hypothetical protein
MLRTGREDALPIERTFRLNDKPLSVLHCDGIGDFSAFSGDGTGKNNAAAIAIRDVGPLPPGRYYIVDRGSGGVFSHMRDFLYDVYNQTDRHKWFALYRDDGRIDDWTFVNGAGRAIFDFTRTADKI